MTPSIASASTESLIGPNAVSQLLDVLTKEGGAELRSDFERKAGLVPLPDLTSMIPETVAATAHNTVRHCYAKTSIGILKRAGYQTGDYILANRIPAPAKWLLKALPDFLASRLLAQAVAKHAWTFAGSGEFRVTSQNPLTFTLKDNPLIRGENAASPQCIWHAMVFQRLFNALVDANAKVIETECCAMGHPACRFQISYENT
ncbi:divinyl protochlorophyllide a 8-vinyl-reductase [Roseibium hamelinense]|uniref:Divinyl protochlorophyllide a 8-vinyl-reductase n=1 Tax=Roseibium hamelinense TaxID=150831 RepID=A0A562SXF6_9HYPH|nr:bacteriochlorophyll 4-vinyl reductase [Roseibium hamelinense]MTI44828.1 bacteriochlorophyll 4-vinyl reductase [Roseibium hamelinense]TWI85979.1 divinyl protochlorophyllide a 8-vinyl-reductase [Roseibium hamelinense]